MRTTRAAIVTAATATVFVLAGACNVFRTLARCDDTSDCPRGFVCDPEGQFCLEQRVAEAGPDADLDGAVEADAREASVEPPPCDMSAPFEGPKLVSGLESIGVFSARFTPKETTVLLSIANGCMLEPCKDLFVAARSDRNAPFSISGPLAGMSTVASAEYWPTMSADGLLLFFESGRSIEKVDGSYVADIPRVWSATRVNTVAEFGEPRLQSIFTLNQIEASPYLHPSGKSLYFASYGRDTRGLSDIYVATLGEQGLAATVENVTSVNTATGELAPVVTLDDRVLYFARDAPAKRDIYFATRTDPTGSFGPPAALPELRSTEYDEVPSWVSDDQCRLYFVSDRPTGPGPDAAPEPLYHLWVATRP